MTEFCGDGTTNNTSEECDDGNTNNIDTCHNDCTKTVCGDGIRNQPNGNGVNENCDDGGTANGDGCDENCQFEGNVPTVTQWGMVTMSLLLLVGLAVKFRRGLASLECCASRLR